jgi:hypothetical protein
MPRIHLNVACALLALATTACLFPRPEDGISTDASCGDGDCEPSEADGSAEDGGATTPTADAAEGDGSDAGRAVDATSPSDDGASSASDAAFPSDDGASGASDAASPPDDSASGSSDAGAEGDAHISGTDGRTWWGGDSPGDDYVRTHCGTKTVANASGRALPLGNRPSSFSMFSSGRILAGPENSAWSWQLWNPDDGSLVFEDHASMAAIAGGKLMRALDSSIEYRSSRDGALLASIATGSQAGEGIASDGSYVWAADPGAEGLQVRAWNEAGVLLMQVALDGEQAIPANVVATPSELRFTLSTLTDDRQSGVYDAVRIPIRRDAVPLYVRRLNSVLDGWFTDSSYGSSGGVIGPSEGVKQYAIFDTTGQVIASPSIRDSNPLQGYGSYFWAENAITGSISIFSVSAAQAPVLSLLAPTPAMDSTWTWLLTGGLLAFADSHGTRATLVDLSIPSLPHSDLDFAEVVGVSTTPLSLTSFLSDGEGDLATATKSGLLNTRKRVRTGRPALVCGAITLTGSQSGLFAIANQEGVALFDAAAAPATFMGRFVGLEPSHIEITDDGKALAVGGMNHNGMGRTLLLEIPSGRTLTSWDGESFSLAKSGGRIATQVGADAVITDLTGTKTFTTIRAKASNLVFSPNGTRVVDRTLGNQAGGSIVIDDGTRRWTVPGHFAGWIDDDRLVICPLIPNPAGLFSFGRPSIYRLADGAESPLPFGDCVPLTPAGPNRVLKFDGIYNVDTGVRLWSKQPQPSDTPFGFPVLAGRQVLFEAGTSLYIQSVGM